MSTGSSKLKIKPQSLVGIPVGMWGFTEVELKDSLVKRKEQEIHQVELNRSLVEQNIYLEQEDSHRVELNRSLVERKALD